MIIKETKTNMSSKQLMKQLNLGKILQSAVLFSLLGVFYAFSVYADVPQILNFQGRLTDSNNNPLSGNFDMAFRICANSACNDPADPLWTESHTGGNQVSISNGVYFVLLGSINPIPFNVFGSGNTYLEVQVSGETLAPRQRFVTSSYAFNAARLSGNATDYFVSTAAVNQSILGGKTFTGTLTVPAPTQDGHAATKLYVDTGLGSTGILGTTQTWTARQTMTRALTVSNTNFLVTGGRVGIGNTSPGTALVVAGTVTANGFVGSGAGLTGTTGGNIIDSDTDSNNIPDGGGTYNVGTWWFNTTKSSVYHYGGLSWIELPISGAATLPTINIFDVAQFEGLPATTTTFAFPVTLSAASISQIVASYFLQDLSTQDTGATPGSDYLNASGQITFAPGETSKTIDVTVFGDGFIEPDEQFGVIISAAPGATMGDQQAQGNILNDDGVTITIFDANVTENDSLGGVGITTMTFNISLSGTSAGTVTVTYTAANVTATSPSDYAAATGVVTFNPGETGKTIDIFVVADLTTESASETFEINLTSPSGATIADAQAIGTIFDDD